MNQHFCEKNQVVLGFAPVSLATGANTGDFVSMKEYGRCAIVFVAGVGAASQDPVVTVLQATSNGGSTKALNFTRIDVKEASALSAVGTFTTVTQAAANTYTSATGGENQKIYVIDIKAEDLDIANGYAWIQVTMADPGTNSQIGLVLYILHEPRDVTVPLPSAIA